MRVHMIANAHIDPVWLWPWQAGADEALATAASMADRCDEYPDFVFTRGEAWLYAAGRAHPPRPLRPHPRPDRARPVARHRRPVHPARPEPPHRRRPAPPDRARPALLPRPLRHQPDRRLQRRQLRPHREPARHPRRATATAPTSSAARSSTRWRSRPTPSSGRAPAAPRSRPSASCPATSPTSPTSAGQVRVAVEAADPGARPHHVLLRRRQPRRRPVEGDDRVDPRQPRLRRPRARLLHARTPSSSAIADQPRPAAARRPPSCSIASPAATA